jgi:hypothetical protein
VKPVELAGIGHDTGRISSVGEQQFHTDSGRGIESFYHNACLLKIVEGIASGSAVSIVELVNETYCQGTYDLDRKAGNELGAREAVCYQRAQQVSKQINDEKPDRREQ